MTANERISARTLLSAALALAVACGDDSASSGAVHASVVHRSQRASADAGTPDGAAPNVAADAGDPDRLETVSLDQDGVQRTYLLKIPTDLDCSTPVPLVINYHPWPASIRAVSTRRACRTAAT